MIYSTGRDFSSDETKTSSFELLLTVQYTAYARLIAFLYAAPKA
jgi:hypothetical protein